MIQYLPASADIQVFKPGERASKGPDPKWSSDPACYAAQTFEAAECCQLCQVAGANAVV